MLGHGGEHPHVDEDLLGLADVGVGLDDGGVGNDFRHGAIALDLGEEVEGLGMAGQLPLRMHAHTFETQAYQTPLF